jgi:hypothetical protein
MAPDAGRGPRSLSLLSLSLLSLSSLSLSLSSLYLSLLSPGKGTPHRTAERGSVLTRSRNPLYLSISLSLSPSLSLSRDPAKNMTRI